MRQQRSALSLSNAPQTFFELRNADGHLALVTWIGGNPLVEDPLRRAPEQLAPKLRIPVLLS